MILASHCLTSELTSENPVFSSHTGVIRGTNRLLFTQLLMYPPHKQCSCSRPHHFLVFTSQNHHRALQTLKVLEVNPANQHRYAVYEEATEQTAKVRAVCALQVPTCVAHTHMIKFSFFHAFPASSRKPTRTPRRSQNNAHNQVTWLPSQTLKRITMYRLCS